jgi:hypothetical protein
MSIALVFVQHATCAVDLYRIKAHTQSRLYQMREFNDDQIAAFRDVVVDQQNS